ncbi:MAG: YebC/PmpR family DNA-binding transcriptional regulator [Phycisphaerales bacterium]
MITTTMCSGGAEASVTISEEFRQMAGHSKWANIKHRKERQDKKKGKMWSKCSKAIMAAARQGGPDPDTNLTLRYAIDEAKYANMPKDTIKRAIEKGAGASGGEDFATITYEGYGPGGVAIIVDALTDNKTRTVSDVRNIFNKGGGNLGSAGAVAFMFDTKGKIVIPADKIGEEDLMERAVEAGADDIQAPEDPTDAEPGFWTVLTPPTEFLSVKDSLEQAGVPIEDAEVSKIPSNTVEVTGEDVRKLMNLIDALEDNDDVQKVYTNASIADEELAGIE